jgi:hypothetical protein
VVEAAALRGRGAQVAQGEEHVVHEGVGHDVELHGGARIARGPRWYTPPFEGPMRLSPDEIQFISRKIVKTLVGAGRLQVDDEAAVIEGIARVVADELSLEDRLNEEAREVLARHSTSMERSDITYSEMFKKVKRELAKKKGIVL